MTIVVRQVFPVGTVYDIILLPEHDPRRDNKCRNVLNISEARVDDGTSVPVYFHCNKGADWQIVQGDVNIQDAYTEWWCTACIQDVLRFDGTVTMITNIE